MSNAITTAVEKFIVAVDARHDGAEPPQKYSVPYGALNDLRFAWLDQLRAATAVAVESWISVADRLPSAGEVVLVAIEDSGHKHVDMGEIVDGRLEPFGLSLCDPTHWMPLPPHPAA